MKTHLFLVLCLLTGYEGFSQQKSNFITWKYTILTEVVSSETEVEILFTGKISDNWKLYGLGFKSTESSPKPTAFHFSENGSFTLIKNPVPLNQKVTAGSEITWFEQKAEFKATIKILEPMADICGKIKGRLFNDKGEVVDFENKFQFY